MIDLEGIREKARRIYEPCLAAYLSGDEAFFPCVLRVNLSANDSDVTRLAESIRQLRAASKQSVGYGFSIDWKEINSRKFGRNIFPRRVSFPTREDLLRFLGKTREFEALTRAVTRLRAAFPELESWIRSDPRQLLAIVEDLEGLIEVCNYLREHPRPGVFARELPLGVDTKFVERFQPLLRIWLDRILPPHTISAAEGQFERRFGLRYAEPHVLLRLLDPSLAGELGLPCDELSLPVRVLNALRMPEVNVIIVENKVTLLTLPPLRNCIALGGLGRGVTLFRDVHWLHGKSIDYWGDIDVSGYEILSALRAAFPQVRSLLMDEEALQTWRHLAQSWTGRSSEAPPYLTLAEQAAYSVCRNDGLRLEQERLPLMASARALVSMSHR
jgi:hypothetical protein